MWVVNGKMSGSSVGGKCSEEYLRADLFFDFLDHAWILNSL